jgi:hypothetical protein
MAKAVKKATAPKAIAKVVAKVDPTEATMRDQIDALVAKIKANVTDLHNDVAIACARIVVHATEYGDVTLADRLIAAFGEKNKTLIRANMLRAWFETYGPFRFDDETKKYKLNGKKQDELRPRIATLKDKQKFTRELAEDCKPWEIKPEKAYKGINVLAIMKSTIKRIESEAKKHADDPKTNVLYLEDFKATLHKVELAHADALAKVAKAG